MGYVLARIREAKGVRERHAGSCRLPGRPLIAPNSFAARALEQADRLAGSRIEEASHERLEIAVSDFRS
jgi:hypothetical protein